jgi:alkane 1-monooxygenase
MKALEYALIYLVPISVIIGLISGNLFIFLTPLLVFGLIPLLDLIIAKDTANPPDDQAPALSASGALKPCASNESGDLSGISGIP